LHGGRQWLDRLLGGRPDLAQRIGGEPADEWVGIFQGFDQRRDRRCRLGSRAARAVAASTRRFTSGLFNCSSLGGHVDIADGVLDFEQPNSSVNAVIATSKWQRAREGFHSVQKSNGGVEGIQLQNERKLLTP
jgi:hypothetical protein